MADVCRSCKAPIRWAVTSHDRSIPIDVEPSPDGNLFLRRNRFGVVEAKVVPEGRRDELAGELYLAHFATCPYADQHRRRRGA